MSNMRLQKLKDRLYALFQGLLRSFDFQSGLNGRLIGCINTGKALDLTRSCFFIQAFDIPGLTNLYGRIDINFKEILRANNLSCHFPNLPGRTDKGIERNNAAVEVQFGNLCNTADVFLAVFRTKAEVVINSAAYIVAIKYLGEETIIVKIAFEVLSDGAFSGAGQSCKPEGFTALTKLALPVIPLQQPVKDRVDMFSHNGSVLPGKTKGQV